MLSEEKRQKLEQHIREYMRETHDRQEIDSSNCFSASLEMPGKFGIDGLAYVDSDYLAFAAEDLIEGKVLECWKANDLHKPSLENEMLGTSLKVEINGQRIQLNRLQEEGVQLIQALLLTLESPKQTAKEAEDITVPKSTSDKDSNAQFKAGESAAAVEDGSDITHKNNHSALTSDGNHEKPGIEHGSVSSSGSQTAQELTDSGLASNIGHEGHGVHHSDSTRDAPLTLSPLPINEDPTSSSSGQSPKNSTMAIVSLVLGLISIVGCCWFICSIPAWIIGNMAQKEIDNSHGALTGRPMATAGKIMGIISTIFGVLYIVFVIIIAITENM